MKVTVDINVLLDVFQKREPHYAASAQVVSMVTAGRLAGICPAHGLTTLFYLVRKHASKPDAEAAMDQVLRHFQIGNLEAAGWQDARRLLLGDFEDAVVATVGQGDGIGLYHHAECGRLRRFARARDHTRRFSQSTDDGGLKFSAPPCPANWRGLPAHCKPMSERPVPRQHHAARRLASPPHCLA